MSVKNVKVQYIRKEKNSKGEYYRDLKHWMEDENNVYVGRRGIVFIKDEEGNKKRFPPENSVWCNPFKVKKNKNEAKDGDNRDEIVSKFEVYMRNMLEENEELKTEFMKLKGKNLGCWCKPERCHGDILIKLLGEMCVSK